MKQQLTTSQKIVSKQQESRKDRREDKGRVLAISRRIYCLQRTDAFYVESQSSDGIYYFVKFKPDVFELCSCKDNSTRHLKCKHLFAIECAIKWGTIRDIEKLPAVTIADVKLDTAITKQQQKPIIMV